MNSDKAKIFWKLLLKFILKQGAKDLLAYGLPIIGITFIPSGIIDWFQEIIDSTDNNVT